jgi:hypothetical protein
MRRSVFLLALASAVVAVPAWSAESTDVAVLRNTVVNILDAMVQKGLISKDAAEKLVADAQAKATSDAAAREAGDQPAPGDVRVTYVPAIVKDEISQQVAVDVQQKVTDDVVARARAEGWGVPGALPEWVRQSTWSGDLRLRVAPVFLSDSNSTLYKNFQAINEAGGEAKAGANALLNTTQDQTRYAARLRFGVETRLSDIASVGFRLATGDRDNPVSANVGLDNYDNGFAVRVDEAWIRLGRPLQDGRNAVYFEGGRMQVPFETSELVWDPDLRFNGFALQYSANAGPGPRGMFANAGWFPLQGSTFASDERTLGAAQLGYEWGAREDTAKFTVAAAYYNYNNETGKANPPGQSIYNYTAPDWVQKGNTLFDISDPTDPDSNLYALAAGYELLDIIGKARLRLGEGLQLDLVADYVTNLGYSVNDVLQRTGALVPERADGYRAEFRLGTPRIAAFGDWSVGAAYTHLERDAVVDGFADSDFHGGGTDAEGYTLSGEMGITHNTWLRLRYLSANEIDGPPLAVDILLLDLNATF